MKLPEYILEIIHTINNNGYEAYVVGGCVRDYLLNRPIHDYDICTSAKPEVILNLFDRCWNRNQTWNGNGFIEFAS